MKQTIKRKAEFDPIRVIDNPTKSELTVGFIALFIIIGLFIFTLTVIHKIENKTVRETICRTVCWKE